MKTQSRPRKPQTAAGPQPLADFLHGCSPDPGTRTMAAAIFALTHRQIAGVTAGSQPPWLLMVNAGDARSDPLDCAANYFSTGMSRKIVHQQGSGLLVGVSPEQAKRRMLQTIEERRMIGDPTTPFKEGEVKQLEQIFAAGKGQLYGHGRNRHYAHLWQDKMGWLTDHSDDIILPHLAEANIDVGEWSGLFWRSVMLGKGGMKPMEIPPCLPDNHWSRHYEPLMRARLRELPGDYEFAVLRAVRELQPMCWRLARHFARKGSETHEVADLFMDLHHMAYRGIVIGPASLAWHGLGIDAGCGADWTFKLMQHLHGHGPVSRGCVQGAERAGMPQESRCGPNQLAGAVVEGRSRRQAPLPQGGWVDGRRLRVGHDA